jgi:uncharacterized protein
MARGHSGNRRRIADARPDEPAAPLACQWAGSLPRADNGSEAMADTTRKRSEGPVESLDASTLRRWCRACLEDLGQAREEIDALNVYPVPDGDTGTNLYLTLECAAEALEAESAATGGVDGVDLPATARAMTYAALTGARGNSGVIFAQLLHGLAEVLAAAPVRDGAALRRALRRASELAYAAVAEPVEGTILTVARAAAEAAEASGTDALATVARAAADGAREALAGTPGQLEVLRHAGVVDAGGRGLCVMLDALVAVVTGIRPVSVPRTPVPRPGHATPADAAQRGRGGPAFEVMYLLDAAAETVRPLKSALAGLGDSLVVVGGDGLWNVHVHTDDVGAAIEAGIAAGRPHRIQVTHFGEAVARRHGAEPAAGAVTGLRFHGPGDGSPARAVVCVAHGDGLARVYESSGATVVTLTAGPRRPSTAELLDAIVRAHAREVVVLPNDMATQAVADVAAERARAEGIRVAVVPAKASVQAIAALAVHDPGRRFDADVVAMTAAAGATRFGELTTAARQAWTTAGICQAGDVLGLIDSDVAVIGSELPATAVEVVERMLSGGGEMVTLVAGVEAPDGLVDRLVEHLHATRPEVETVVYDGGQAGYPLLIGVE